MYFTKRIIAQTLFVVITLITLNSCVLNKINQQKKLVENYGTITGVIEKPENASGNIVLQLYTLKENTLFLTTQRIVSKSGSFNLDILANNYYILAYVDENNDSEYQRDELACIYGLPSQICVEKDKVATLDPIVISDKQNFNKTEVEISDGQAIWNNIGEITSLSDPRFDEAFYKIGMWRPVDFLKSAEGGLFFLDKYDPTKTPVLFIHGSAGGPSHWETVINNIDTSRYQALVLYYPSGIRLDIISAYLTEAINRLKTKYGKSDFAIVAHSMGGLICRSFVKNYIQFDKNNINDIKLVATISTPNLGLKSAASGVKNSPIVVPSWRDLTPESKFVTNLQAWQWPQEIPYHLIASYDNGKSDDGVVDLSSQASLKQQTEATHMYLFNNHHAEILANPDLSELINNLLKSINK